MSKAIETGLPKMRIEEAAARKQARIDSGKDVIVGVNSYNSDAQEEFDILEVDNRKVRENQIKRTRETQGRKGFRGGRARAPQNHRMRGNRAGQPSFPSG